MRATPSICRERAEHVELPRHAPERSPGGVCAVNAVVFDIALTAYIVAALAALASLVWRRDGLLLLARDLTAAGWPCTTAASVLRGPDVRRQAALTHAHH